MIGELKKMSAIGAAIGAYVTSNAIVKPTLAAVFGAQVGFLIGGVVGVEVASAMQKRDPALAGVLFLACPFIGVGLGSYLAVSAVVDNGAFTIVAATVLGMFVFKQ